MQNCFGALGTDTGGGIRTPAAYCGVVGFKPTYGRVSLRGIVPFAWSLDHCGPIARTVEDAAMLLQQMAGYDYLDIDSADKPVPNFTSGIGAPVAQFRIGIPVQFYDHLDDDIARAIDDAIAVLKKLTKDSREVALTSLLHSNVGAEVAAFHENLRGVNGGGFEASTGRAFPAADTARAVDYIRGWRDLEMVRRTVDEDIFQKQSVDLLIAPASRHTVPTIEEELTQGAGAPAAGGGRGGAGGAGGGGGGRGAAAAATPTSAADAPATATARGRTQLDPEENTRAFNAYGLPTITIPCGFAKDGMPIGLQIAGAHWSEINVFALAHAYQEATEWHKKRPPLQPDAKVPTLSKAASEQTGG
jgi:aspartyl-tRNA(Asn)/glutamyl-tRNA(Gln) amidotransferase subunit A